MKKSVVILLIIAAAVLLTSAFTFSAIYSSKSSGDEAGVTAASPGGADDDLQSQDGDTDEPPLEDADIEQDVPEEPGEPDELTVCEALETLGIMRGVGTAEDGSVDYAPDRTLTRSEAVTLISRCLGYNGSGADIDYPHAFQDVPDWASGTVGYAYLAGITNGSTDTTFDPEREVTVSELLSFTLRALGYKDFDWQTAYQTSDGIGLTHGQFTDGTKPVTRGETAQVILKLLTTKPYGREKNLLTRLVETGAVDAGSVEAAGLSEYTAGANPDVITMTQALEKYSGAVVTVKPRDIMLNDMPSFHGAIVAKGVVAAGLDDIAGASYLTITDRDGKDLGFKGIIAYDKVYGLVYFSCDAPEPDYLTAKDDPQTEEAPGTAEGETMNGGDSGTSEEQSGQKQETVHDNDPTVYVISDMAVPCAKNKTPGRLGLIVVDGKGEFLGLTTNVGIGIHELQNWAPIDLYEVQQRLWPELCPPVRPRGIDPDKPMTAITYDDGPSAVYTPMLLDLLEKYDTVATFFEVGSNVKAHPQFLTRMESMGCEIANHSWDHSNLKRLSAQGVRDQIQRTDDVIKSYTGNDVRLVRCPGGNSNATVAANVGHPIIYWTIDTRDWESRNASKVIASVQNDSNLDGDIILMHSLYKSTYDASVTLIPWIIDKGYQPVTVSELAFFRGVELVNGETYVKFPPK